MQTRISTIIERKGSTVHTIGRCCTVFDAILAMDTLNVGALLVTDETRLPEHEWNPDQPIGAEQIVGVITERDYLRMVALKGRQSRTTAIEEIMVTDLLVAAPDTRVEEALSVMTHARVRHLPVFDDGHLVGIVSMGDLVKAISREQEAVLQYMQDILSGVPAIIPRFH